jgi:hypothetical protein
MEINLVPRWLVQPAVLAAEWPKRDMHSYIKTNRVWLLYDHYRDLVLPRPRQPVVTHQPVYA